MLASLLALARASVELAEAEVAVGDERAHAARFGKGDCTAVFVLGRFNVRPIGIRCNLPSRHRA